MKNAVSVSAWMKIAMHWLFVVSLVKLLWSLLVIQINSYCLFEPTANCTFTDEDSIYHHENSIYHMYFWAWDPLWAPLSLPKLVTSIWNQFYPLWILDFKNKACQKCKNNKKTLILEKYLHFHTARNQGRWSGPKLKIGQYCAIRIRIQCAKFQVFLKLWTWAS